MIVAEILAARHQVDGGYHDAAGYNHRQRSPQQIDLKEPDWRSSVAKAKSNGRLYSS
jgi:hypothetical protein